VYPVPEFDASDSYNYSVKAVSAKIIVGIQVRSGQVRGHILSI